MRRVLLSLLILVSLRAGDLEAGRLLPRVEGLGGRRAAYALYLPTAYASSSPRAWPLLLVFAPDGDGAGAVALFQGEAERLGWIVAGSLDSRNGPLEPNLKAQQALWEDVHARLRVDRRRVAAAGFSGGARMAMRLALDHPGGVAGLISFGGFYPEGRGVDEKLRLAFFLACGDRDFNFFEQREAFRVLRFRGLNPWWETFPGPHRWPPASVAARGLGFLHLTLGDGASALPPDEVADLLRSWVREAEAALDQGRKGAACRLAEAMEGRFRRVPGWGPLPPRLAVLARDPEVRAERDAEEEAESLARRIWASRGEGRGYLKALQELQAEQRRAEGPRARLRAMILEGECLELGHLARIAYVTGDFPLAASRFAALADLAVDGSVPAYNAACAWARAGRPEEGLAWLRRAVSLGFRDRDLLRADPDLETVRRMPGFAGLLPDP